MKTLITTTLCVLFVAAGNVSAKEYQIGELTITQPYARSTPPFSPVAGGFMTITNNGETADRLIGGSSRFSETVEVHEMVMTDGVMKMGQIEGGLEIPAGETVTLKPGGFHLMFIGLQEQLKPEEIRQGSIRFKHAGALDIDYVVKDIAKMMKHGKMKHHKMEHKKSTDQTMHHDDSDKAEGSHDHSSKDHSVEMDHSTAATANH